MQKVLLKCKQIIFAKQTSIFSSTVIISTMVIISRVFGFIRYHIFLDYFSEKQMDVFFAAFRIPDLIFEILITGAVTTSLIPFFIKYQKDKERLSEYLSTIINIIMLLLFAFIVVLILILPKIMIFITPGFDKQKISQLVFFSQVLLAGQLPFFVFGTILTGISQARKAFLLPAIAPIVYNIFIILFTLFFASKWHLNAPIIGVVTGAFLFFLLQTPILLLSNFDYQFVIKRSKEVFGFFRTVIPRVFTVIIAQIDATIDLTLSTLLGSGSYSVFYLAQHLQLLPVSVLGISFGQASLPYLSEAYQEENPERLQRIIASSILNLFFMTIPIAFFLIFSRTPIVRLSFGGEKFDWGATVQTAVTLSYFAVSLPFHSIYYFLTRCFYAIFDSKTPFYISLLSVALNTFLSLYFILILKLPVQSMAASFSISMILMVLLLLVILYKRIHGLNIGFLLAETVKIVFAASIASFLSFYLQKLLDKLILDTTRTLNVILLLALVGSTYFLLYLFLTWIFNVKEIYLITKITQTVKEYQRKISEVYTGIQNNG